MLRCDKILSDEVAISACCDPGISCWTINQLRARHYSSKSSGGDVCCERKLKLDL